MSRWLLSLVLLTLVYLLVLGSFDPWNLLTGVLVSVAVLLFYHGFLFAGRPRPLRGLVVRTVALLPLLVVTVWEITQGVLRVALIVLHLRPLVRPGVVAIPMEDRTPTGVDVSGLLHTLGPGSYLVDMDWERRVMLFHVIDATDPDAIRREYSRLYHRFQRHVFP